MSFAEPIEEKRSPRSSQYFGERSGNTRLSGDREALLQAVRQTPDTNAIKQSRGDYDSTDLFSSFVGQRTRTRL